MAARRGDASASAIALGCLTRTAICSNVGPGKHPAGPARLDAPRNTQPMDYQSTEQPSGSFFASKEYRVPTVIFAGSTVHVVLPHQHALASAMMALTECSPPAHTFLLFQLDELSKDTVGLHWGTEYVTCDGHSHVLSVLVSGENCDHAVDLDEQYSENSWGSRQSFELAGDEMARFGLTSGTLFFDGTRTLRVWEAPARAGEVPTAASTLFEQKGIGCFSWLPSLTADVFIMLSDDEDDDSFPAW